MKLTATHTIELELQLSATYHPARAVTPPSYASGGDPAEPECVEDVAVRDIGVIMQQSRWAGAELRWKTHSILDGIDRKSPVYAQLVKNLLRIIGEGAEAALLLEVGE